MPYFEHMLYILASFHNLKISFSCFVFVFDEYLAERTFVCTSVIAIKINSFKKAFSNLPAEYTGQIGLLNQATVLFRLKTCTLANLNPATGVVLRNL